MKSNVMFRSIGSLERVYALYACCVGYVKSNEYMRGGNE